MKIIRNLLQLFDFGSLTLKRRIFILFLISSLIPFIFAGFISYNTIYSILTNKIQDSIHRSLKQVGLSLENAFGNLNYVSQQLAFQGTIGKHLEVVLTTDKPFERSQMISQINSELNLITFTNPSVGLTLYYFRNEGTYLFENSGVKPGFSLKDLPLLAQYYGITYYGPHISNDRFNNQYVLSALRKVNLPSRDDVYVYIETGFKLTQSILDNDIGHYLFLDNNGRIAFSDIPGKFPVNTMFKGGAGEQSSGALSGYYWFKEPSNQGWSIISMVSKADYNKEMNRWFLQILLFSLLFLSISLILAWILWKMVYRPLSNFNKEIRLMADNRVIQNPTPTKIPEFDSLLHQFRGMKIQIWDLFAEVEQKEKRRADLEVEKLLYQINPHFLMNTLDTVHWLAVMNNQDEIDRIVLSLNKLLHYNLGKLGQSSTIREEINALNQYLVLQQIRYDFQFNVQVEVKEEVLDMPIPRFILQPLVENSLYHGFSDDGQIQVNVRLDHDRTIEISIHDNGAGMTAEAIDHLLNNEQIEREKVGMGIGMNYVKRMIEVYYGENAKLGIESELGKGTSIYLSLPVREAESKHD